MKKSKIIVPAVALLALGMAASVTGTVAWFDANNSVSASQMSASVSSIRDLRISAGHSATPSWKTALSLPDDAAWVPHASNNGGLAAAVEGDVSGCTAVYGTGNTSSTGVSTSGISFVEPDLENNTVNAMTGAAGTAIKTDGTTNSPAYKASENYVQGSYDLLYQGGDASATANLSITVGSSQSKAIDAALMIGVIQDSKIFTYKLGSYSSGYAAVSGPSITLSKDTKKSVDVYLWYDGTDSNAKNANAELNTLTFVINYTLAA